MTVGQLPVEAGAFVRYLRDLTALLDKGEGWCAVFWQRDPDGMRACLDGAELPPWDVLEALLHDLAAQHGTEAAEHETVRARALHTAAAAAHDRRPGAREGLVERLGAMRRERAYAAQRERELTQRLRGVADGAEAEGLGLELAWARDDHERATARCGELGARLEALETLPSPSRPARPPAPDSWFRAEAPEADEEPFLPHPAPSRGDTLRLPPRGGSAPDLAPQAPPDFVRGDPQGLNSAPPALEDFGKGRGGEKPRRTPKRRPRGARYAGLDADAGGSAVTLPTSDVATPRGARYAGVEEKTAAPPPVVAEAAHLVEDGRAVTGAVAALVQLRAQGRTGEAHVLLCEAAAWPAGRLPMLAGALHRAGLGADWATLLWELASLPVDRVAAVSGALHGAGLGEDGRQLLRQGVARPAPEIAAGLLALVDVGREREVRALVDAFVRVRTPEDAARVAQNDPPRLAPLLLDAARQVSQGRYWDVVHALRVAGAAP
ncbi:hypothetical protein J7I98_24545 [Streptomyces sp. ISL-98]|uniref:hypothetical protein n=1 Tax=Streptomyces sp. ISL-98 TaxID=2819192 RepID=UPI001BEC4B7B|nr:hypothetical protein [Streptomyces sp. ISL-98]MBT2508999.1 hypothetical protein [Streptomyces sp. ISL-98]